MKKTIERLKYKIKESGYLSTTRLTLMLLALDPDLNDRDIKKVFKALTTDGIHRIEYTNSYVAPYTRKSLYLYNPDRAPAPKPVRAVRKTKKRATKPKARKPNE